MEDRKQIVSGFYANFDENERLVKSRQGQLEYATTMHYIKKFLSPKSKIIEIGAGTGRYSIALAKNGHEVTAIDLVDKNLEILKSNAGKLNNLKAYKCDAVDLSKFDDNTFDMTLSFGPFYHLYSKKEISKAIDEAVRVTKPGGIIMYAFLSIYAIMDTNYMYGRWNEGLKENFDKKLNVLHFDEQLFTGYDVVEFEELFKNKNVDYITTVGVDGNLESLEKIPSFSFTDKDFESYINWYLNFAEKRELLGKSSHLLYLCKKR